MPFVYAAWVFLAKVVKARSMKLMTRASRAPGVSSVGIICAAIASTSRACAGVKNPNFIGLPDWAAFST